MQAGRRVAGALAAALLGALAASGPALAATPGGAAPTAPAVVRDVTCVKGCAGARSANPGGVVKVTGSHLDATVSVLFDGAKAKPKKVTAGSLQAVVPAKAKTGRVTVVSVYEQRASSPRVLTVVPPEGEPAPAATMRSTLVDTALSTARVLYYGRRPAQLTYTLKTPAPADVRVDLVRLRDERSLVQWTAQDVPPGVARRIRWNGLVHRRVPAGGRYEFRISVGSSPAPGSAVGAAASPATAARAGDFSFLPWVFPVRGRHDFGGAGNRFGAGRSGHTHQGQDILTACGTPIVAARGGTVKYRAYQSLAGNYVVIDGAGTGTDTVYMHLRSAALVSRGEKVYTGQVIGYAGDTGDASACHLHFEMWSAPGWYSGGHPFDPLPSLRAWDRVS